MPITLKEGVTNSLKTRFQKKLFHGKLSTSSMLIKLKRFKSWKFMLGEYPVSNNLFPFNGTSYHPIVFIKTKKKKKMGSWLIFDVYFLPTENASNTSLYSWIAISFQGSDKKPPRGNIFFSFLLKINLVYTCKSFYGSFFFKFFFIVIC